MKLILRELDGISCLKYIKCRLDGMLYFSNAISHDLKFESGKFYTITPKDIIEEHLYEFETGGRVYPYKREEGTLIQQVMNQSDNIITSSLYEFVISNTSHAICLEGFTASPAAKYVINSNRQYYLIDNRIYYLIDETFSLGEIAQYFNWANSFGFLCALVKIPFGLGSLSLASNATLNDSSKSIIFNGINSFPIEIYDGESYLIWIDDKEGGAFEDILRKGIDASN